MFINKSTVCHCPIIKPRTRLYNYRSLASKADRNRQMMLLLSRSSLQRSVRTPSVINGFDNKRHIGMIFLRVVRHFAKLRYLVLGGVGTGVMAAKVVNFV